MEAKPERQSLVAGVLHEKRYAKDAVGHAIGQCRRIAKWHRSHGIEVEYGAFRPVLNEIPPRAMMGSGEASGRGRAQKAAELAITDPLLDETSMRCAQGVLSCISGGPI